MRLSVAILVAMYQNQAGNCQTLLLNENFDYVAGSNLTSNGWSAHSGAGTNPVKVNSAGLSFPGYPSSDIGLSALLAKDGEDVNRSFITVTSGTVFCAFLVQVNVIVKGYFLHLFNSSIGSQKGKVFINGKDNFYNIGLSMGTVDTVYTTGSPFTIGKTYLIVLKYSIVEGVNNDEVSLYIITGSIPGTEPATPTTGPLTDGKSDLNNVSAVALRQYSAKQNILVDGIRVATKWEDLVGTVTGDNDLSMKDNPVLYPDPVSTELTISNLHNIKILEIFDITGRKVISVKPEDTDYYKIPVTHLSRGFFLLRVTTQEGTKTMKFFKL